MTHKDEINPPTKVLPVHLQPSVLYSRENMEFTQNLSASLNSTKHGVRIWIQTLHSSRRTLSFDWREGTHQPSHTTQGTYRAVADNHRLSAGASLPHHHFFLVSVKSCQKWLILITEEQSSREKSRPGLWMEVSLQYRRMCFQKLEKNVNKDKWNKKMKTLNSTKILSLQLSTTYSYQNPFYT